MVSIRECIRVVMAAVGAENCGSGNTYNNVIPPTLTKILYVFFL
jgi:hypothetical protein